MAIRTLPKDTSLHPFLTNMGVRTSVLKRLVELGFTPSLLIPHVFLLQLLFLLPMVLLLLLLVRVHIAIVKRPTVMRS
jgi:hypothetical protein